MKAAGILLIAVMMAGAVSEESEARDIYIMTIASAISPGIADFVKRSIDDASAANAACLIIELDTPGGLADSMRQIVMAIYASPVPVIVYVSPSGARAASAGVMVTMAADVAAMAPSTNIGAASPVAIGGKDIDETMLKKMNNDMVAYVKGIAGKRGRNAEWVEKAVREAASVTEKEALEGNIVDLIAEDIDDLIRQVNGRDIEGKGTLDLANAGRIRLTESLRTKILKTISDPNIAYILMMIGLAGLYFELSHPGAIFPGVVGGISIILAFFAFQTLPVNYAGILLIVLAIVFFILEVKIASYGMLSVAGVVSLLLGSLMLYRTGDVHLQVSWWAIGGTLAIVSGFFVCIAYLAFRAQTIPPMTGAAGLIGETGTAKTPLTPKGKVFVRGELWNALAAESIEAGEDIAVTGVEKLVLKVEKTTSL